MPRRAPLAIAAALGVLALTAPAVLVARVLPPSTEYRPAELGVAGEVPYPLRRAGGERRLEVDVGPFAPLADARLQVRVATYASHPRDVLRLDAVGPAGSLLASCRFPPSAYTDNGTIGCPIARPERLRRLRLTAVGPAPVALYAARRGGRLASGYVARRHEFAGLGSRLHAAYERIGVTRPAVVSPPVLLVLFVAGVGLVAAAWLLLARPPRAR